MLMMIPEAWENHDTMDATKRAFYRFHSSLMEPWDGPASVAFTDGSVIGAVLDRNGLRPSRYWVTDDDLVVLASEVGVLARSARSCAMPACSLPNVHVVPPGRIVERRDQAPGGGGAAVPSGGRRGGRARRLPDASTCSPQSVRAATGFGYTHEGAEDNRRSDGKACRAIGSMGTATPLAVLSESWLVRSSNSFRKVPTHRSMHSPGGRHVGSGSVGPRPICTAGPESCRQLTLPFR